MNVSGVSVKEVVEIIESRIPGGRYVTSILISLLALTVAVWSGIYLYHYLILSIVLGIASLIKTGHVAAPTVASIIGSIIGSVILYVTFQIAMNTVLTDYKKAASVMGVVLEHQSIIGRRLDTIETRVSALEK
jgi:hypothetical protein